MKEALCDIMFFFMFAEAAVSICNQYFFCNLHGKLFTVQITQV